MGTIAPWQPPVENAAYRHSVFVDVELWDELRDRRTWSCAYLAAVWQLLRLGLLRHRGLPVAEPSSWDGDYPDEWSRLPAVVRLSPSAAPFSAYRTLSVLPGRFLPTEQAVRTILTQVAVDSAVVGQTVARGKGEGLVVPPETVDRIDYVFVG
jgi:hypothetical protein